MSEQMIRMQMAAQGADPDDIEEAVEAFSKDDAGSEQDTAGSATAA